MFPHSLISLSSQHARKHDKTPCCTSWHPRQRWRAAASQKGQRRAQGDYLLPIRSTKISKAELPGGFLRSGSTGFAVHEVQGLCSLPGASRVREEGRRRVQRAPQVQARLGKSDLVISTERVDEGAWLIGHRVNRGLVEVLDSHRPRPWTPGGLRGGWTAGRWRASS